MSAAKGSSALAITGQHSPLLSLPLTIPQCDERTPSCLRCEKSGVSCPGYRDLVGPSFRDETRRILRLSTKAKAKASFQVWPAQRPCTSNKVGSIARANSSDIALRSPSLAVSHPPALPVLQAAISFFFTRFSFDEAPFSGPFQQWLIRSFVGAQPDSALRACIEAIGLAALSNIEHASSIAAYARYRYCSALRSMRRSLDDKRKACTDTTLMAAILCGLFEVSIYYLYCVYSTLTVERL